MNKISISLNTSLTALNALVDRSQTLEAQKEIVNSLFLYHDRNDIPSWVWDLKNKLFQKPKKVINITTVVTYELSEGELDILDILIANDDQDWLYLTLEDDSSINNLIKLKLIIAGKGRYKGKHQITQLGEDVYNKI